MTPAATTDVARAVAWMLGSVVAFCAMAVGGRELAPALDTFEIMAWRSLIGLAVVLAVGAATGRLGGVRVRRMPLYVTRNVAHFAGQNLWFYAVATIPLAQVFAIEFTAPIWAMLAAPLVLGERLGARRLGAGLVGFAGALIVARPGAGLDPGQAAAALAAVAFALTTLTTKLLTRTEPLISILFWLTAMQSVMGLATALWDGRMAAPPAPLVPWMLVVGLGGLAAHLCLTRALTLAPATVVAPVDFARLPVIAVVGALVYGEAMAPHVALGAAIIVGANWFNVLRESHLRRARDI